MRKKVSCSDVELLENLDRSITEFSEQINEQKLYYTQRVEQLKISNENAEKVRQQNHIESKASLMKANPVSQSQHSLFASVKKIAIPVGVAAAGITLAAAILKCV